MNGVMVILRMQLVFACVATMLAVGPAFAFGVFSE